MSALALPAIAVYRGYESVLSLEGAAREALKNPYLVHQRILNAWPSGRAGRVLWRKLGGGRLAVRHPEPAAWGDAFRDSELRAVDSGPAVIELMAGQRLAYRVMMSATRCDHAGRKVGITDPVAREEWFRRLFAMHGIRVEVMAEGRGLPYPVKHGVPLVTLTRDYRGELVVTDPEAMAAALGTGLGRAKAFGCGLLCIGEVT